MKKIDKESFLYAKLRDFQHLYEQTELVYDHAPDRGGPREQAVRNYFKNHLPQKYGVTTGKILSPNGSLSRQIDVLIFDEINCPVLYSEKTGDEYQIIPSESVVGTVEVKSILDKTIAYEILHNIDSVQEVTSSNHRKSALVCAFFCYATPIFNSQHEIDTYSQQMCDIFSNEYYKTLLKVGCVLPNKKNTINSRIMETEPCFFFFRKDISLDNSISKSKQKKIPNSPVFAESDPEVLLPIFMSIFSDELGKWKPRKYSIYNYMFNFGKYKT